MNWKEPIKSIDEIKRVNITLKKKKYREYLIVKIGLTTGLRISDILEFRKRTFSYGRRFTIKEKKTGKPKKIELDKTLYEELKMYVKGKRDYEYVFKTTRNKNKPICYKTVWNNINECCNSKEKKISMHTIRKTYAYTMYQETGDFYTIMEALNHDNERVTMRYLGISDDVVNKANKKVTKKIYG